MNIPHPFPYQGSKRNIARQILRHFPGSIDCLYEPFCGTAAVSIAALFSGAVKRVHLNDLNTPLMALWREILDAPEALSTAYERLWHAQHRDSKAFFLEIRDAFNFAPEPHLMLYLLARIVKGAVRYAPDGRFNQSADHRRLGMRPETMHRQLLAISAMLAQRTTLTSGDFRAAIASATTQDLVYLDPPYQGTSSSRDRRYLDGIDYHDLVTVLDALNARNISFLVSYDGRTGEKVHGRPLPETLGLSRLEIAAGTSAQSTLLGNRTLTVESLYLSPSLVKRQHATGAPRTS
jgi:DNA adenine methylase